MATTPVSVAHRSRQQVYVDVPQSPYPIAPSPSHKLTPAQQLTSSKLKENTFHGAMPRPFNDIPNLKRKASGHDIPPPGASAKKQKFVETSVEIQQPTNTTNLAKNACPGFPNGFIYCHQCSHKRDAATSISCTSNVVKGVAKRCVNKLCAKCLKNRYGEDVEAIKANGSNGNYTFTCPRCRDICNCWRCRKLKGLPPVGKTAAHKPQPTSETQTSSKGQSKVVEVLITTTPSKVSVSQPSTVTAQSKKPETTKLAPKPKPEAKSKQQTLRQMIPQTLPVLKWTKVQTNLDREDVESRFLIREFVLRFSSAMKPSIPRTQLVELDIVGFVSEDDELAPWVSEACVRSMILGLLGMLASTEEPDQKIVQSAIRNIRATGNNLNKIWSILVKLQEDVEDLVLPDPLPPPASATVYNTRTTRSAQESNGSRSNVVIGHTAQMIPVIEALIEAASETPAIREELETGVKEGKEMTREVQNCIREERERWDAERKLEIDRESSEKEKGKSKIFLEIKLKREIHKAHVRDLENALKLVTMGFSPRFTPLLGTDTGKKRVFWAPSPGAIERQSALDFIVSASLSKKANPRPRTARDDLSDWSGFLAVWGKKIPDLKGKTNADEDVERWWAFSEPAEIRKVADWIRIDAGIDPHGDADAHKSLALLVKALDEYAVLLEWRMKEDKYRGIITRSE